MPVCFSKLSSETIANFENNLAEFSRIKKLVENSKGFTNIRDEHATFTTLVRTLENFLKNPNKTCQDKISHLINEAEEAASEVLNNQMLSDTLMNHVDDLLQMIHLMKDDISELIEITRDIRDSVRVNHGILNENHDRLIQNGEAIDELKGSVAFFGATYVIGKIASGVVDIYNEFSEIE